MVLDCFNKVAFKGKSLNLSAKQLKVITLSLITVLSTNILPTQAATERSNTNKSIVQEAQKEGQRIISVGSSITEIIYEIGEGKQVVAVDVTSQYPKPALKLPKIGYHRMLSSEGILALKPTMIVGSDEMGPSVVLDHLKEVVSVKTLPTDNTLDNLYDRIDTLATLFNHKNQGNKLKKDIQENIVFAQSLQPNKESEKVKVLLLLTHRGTPVAAGADTTANTLIELAGGKNVASDLKGFKPLSPEALLEMDPDFILMAHTAKAGNSNAKAQLVQQLPGIESSRAGQADNIEIIDDALLVAGLGPRTGKAVRQLSIRFYPKSLKKS